MSPGGNRAETFSLPFGDYSSTFTITNELDAPLRLVNQAALFGYWLRGPPNLIDANSDSEPIQLKDKACERALS